MAFRRIRWNLPSCIFELDRRTVRRVTIVTVLVLGIFLLYGGGADAQQLNWVPQQKIVGVATSRAPALGVLHGSLYAAWKGAGNDEGIYWTTYGAVAKPGGGIGPEAWATSPNQLKISNVGTSFAPSLTTFPAAGLSPQIFAAWKGVNGDPGIYWTSCCNAQTWIPQENARNVVGTDAGPSLAVFGNLIYAAWKGPTSANGVNDQQMHWYTFDGRADSDWVPLRPTPVGETSFGPSLAVFGSRLFAAWKSKDAAPEMYYAYFDGKTWSNQIIIPNTGTSAGPSLAVFGNLLWAIWKGAYDDNGIYYAAFNGNGWGAQNRIPNVGTSDRPALAMYDNRLYAVWKGAYDDPGIYYSYTPLPQ